MLHFVILLVGFNLFYLLSLLSCPKDGWDDCVAFFKERLTGIFTQILLSASFFIAIEVLCIQGFFPPVFLVITVGNLYYLTFCYSVKKSFADHGGVNRIPFLALIAIFNLLYLIVSTVLYFMRRMRRLTIAVVAVLTVTTALYIYYGRIKDSCVGWEYGLAGK